MSVFIVYSLMFHGGNTAWAYIGLRVLNMGICNTVKRVRTVKRPAHNLRYRPIVRE